MIAALRSYFKALSATSRFGRASRLREKGRNEEALAMAREALAILGGAGIRRANPAEASILVCATVLVEEIARELNVPGADVRDISDTVTAIRANGSTSEFAEWVPYLEWRLNHGSASAV